VLVWQRPLHQSRLLDVRIGFGTAEGCFLFASDNPHYKGAEPQILHVRTKGRTSRIWNALNQGARTRDSHPDRIGIGSRLDYKQNGFLRWA
jgi:hypothetical protein